jgi:hypothetical protein
VFHGHAHHGQPEGRTAKNVPVYNVSMSLMRTVFPDKPFRLLEVDVTAVNDRTDDQRADELHRQVTQIQTARTGGHR